MRSTTHVAATALLSAALFEPMRQAAGTLGAWVGVWALMAGSKAPDWMELRRWVLGKRLSLIAHRTLTHTWWVWVVVLVSSSLWAPNLPWSVWAIRLFSVSCLLHIAMDALTPMGVPVLNPFGRKATLLAKPVGDFSFLVGWACLVAAVYLLDVARWLPLWLQQV